MNFEYFIVFDQVDNDFVNSFMHLVKFLFLICLLLEDFFFHILANVK